MLIVPVPTPEAVAERYDLPLEDLKAWLGRTRNARLLGSIDSPSIQGEVERFRYCAHLTDEQLEEAWQLSRATTAERWGSAVPINPAWRAHYRNEVQGRGLLRGDQLRGRVIRGADSGYVLVGRPSRNGFRAVVRYSMYWNACRALRSRAAIRRAIENELEIR